MVGEAALGSLQSIQSSAADGDWPHPKQSVGFGSFATPLLYIVFNSNAFALPREPWGHGSPLGIWVVWFLSAPNCCWQRSISCSLMFLIFKLHDFCRNADPSQFSFKSYYLQSSLSAVRPHKALVKTFRSM